MVNSSPYGHFKGKRGIHQGDPMSPYLFVLVVELFSDLLRKEVKMGNYKLYHKGKDPVITHLFFADDLIAFLNGDRAIVECITRVLQEFRRSSGLQVNHKKFGFFVQVYQTYRL